MGDARNLSFSTGFNQPKIIVNSHQSVSIPVSSPFTPDTLLTIPTNLSTTPLPARVSLLYNGTFCPMFGADGDVLTVLGVDILFIAGYDANNNLIIKSYSQELGATTMTIYYRIYQDARPS